MATARFEMIDGTVELVAEGTPYYDHLIARGVFPVGFLPEADGISDVLQDYLSATYATVDLKSPLGPLAGKLRGGESATVALAGDSTGDETAEWWYRVWAAWGVDHREYTISYKGWNDGAQAYDAPTTVQTGAKQARASSDGFDRTAAELVGSTSPRGGSNWAGQTGNWSVGSSAANWVASGGGFNALPGTVNGSKKTASGNITIDTTNTGNDRVIHLGMYLTGSNVERLALRLRVTAAGVIQIGIDGQFPGWAQVTADTTKAITVGATTTLAWSLAVDGTAVTATVGGLSVTGTLSGAQQTSVQGMNGIYVMPTGALTGLKLLDTALDVYDTASAPVLTVLNGSKSGSDLTYQQTRLATMFPGSIDALWISASHNYAATTASDYTTALAAFIAAYRALHAESRYCIVAQNPQAAPASNRVAHRARCVAAKAYAQDNACAVLDFLRTFESYPGWAATLLRVDGIHPTAASVMDEASDPANGQYQMMLAARTLLTAAGA